jgi:hypothetical protein
MKDRRHATTERITALTGEIGTTVAQLVLLWPWQRVRARVLATHLGKLFRDLLAELGNQAASMAARAVVRPVEMITTKQDEAIERLKWIELRMEQRDEAVAERLTAAEERLAALEAGGE